MSNLQGTLMPFLYPWLLRPSARSVVSPATCLRLVKSRNTVCRKQCQSTLIEINTARRAAAYEPALQKPSSRLNPTPDDYGRAIFVDKCTLTLYAGNGGNGCVSFLRDVHISDGPPNGGDGGSGGSVWIQATPGHTSLHKLARRRVIKAERGSSGKGSSQGGKKGEDICIQVPVGTVVREVWRSDPVAEEEERLRELGGSMPMAEVELLSSERTKYILYPGTPTSEANELNSTLPPPKPRKSHLAALQPPRPINLDLDKPMDKPMLLVAGAMGGLGNTHFTNQSEMKPKYATKGEQGTRVKLELELKLLADVGLVGLPNAGKSTFLRAISNSRTRIGSWAFTTLQPNIGTVILDNNEGLPLVKAGIEGEAPRTKFTVADIPGLIEDAHLDKGLGLDFLRHIERARTLAFVIDLSAGDAVIALQNLWTEVGEYENIRNHELNEFSETRIRDFAPFGSPAPSPVVNEDGETLSVFPEPDISLEPLKLPPISAKPWFVVATKADKEDTQEEFFKLQKYLAQVETGDLPHPSGKTNAWKHRAAVLPVSAIRGEGTHAVIEWVASLLDSMQGAGAAADMVDLERQVQNRFIEA